MRPKLYVLALATLLTISGLMATPRTTSAGDGFARYRQQQARLREQAHLRGQGRLPEQARWRSLSTTPKWAVAQPKAGKSPGPARPGPVSSRPSR
jgi:hypothetical protein